MHVEKSDSASDHLPEEHRIAHTLSFVLHDVILEVLRAGREVGLFGLNVRFRDDAERSHFDAFDGDIFEWLLVRGRTPELRTLIERMVLSGLLSDFCHFIYEALTCSRKGKLTVAFALLRKPLYEGLGMFEQLIVDPAGFVDAFRIDPLKVRVQKAGGLAAHARRIERTLAALGHQDRYDHTYLAQLRYDKDAEDSFERLWHKALHLITEHKSVRTEPMNLNLVYSGIDALRSQWGYLYARLPYLLSYARDMVEYLVARCGATAPRYLDDIDVRCSAGVILWSSRLDQRYRTDAIGKLGTTAAARLAQLRTPPLRRAWSEAELERFMTHGKGSGLHEAIRRAASRIIRGRQTSKG